MADLIVRERWTAMGEDRPCFVVTNGAWSVDAYPHGFWPLLWVVFGEGRAKWAFGRRHALRIARRWGARIAYQRALLNDGSENGS